MVNKNLFPPYWSDACNTLKANDNKMSELIDKYQAESLRRRNPAFHTIARAIVGQQISVAAADSVWERFEQLLSTNIDAEKLLRLNDEDLRSVGLSRQKVSYLKNCARFFIDEFDNYNDLYEFDHSEVEAKLIKIKGVGRWTVDMFMIFHMHAKDILPISDLGLINAVKKHYNINSKENDVLAKEVVRFSQNWKPYRTVATWYLWRSIDPVPVEY